MTRVRTPAALAAAAALLAAWIAAPLPLVCALAQDGAGGNGGADGARAAAALTEDDRRAFAWFDGLGLPSTAGKPYVRVATGRTWTDQEGRDHRVEIEGFLLSQDEDRFVLLTRDLSEVRVPRAASDTRAAATLAEIDLAAHAAARLADLRRPPSDDPLDPRGSRFFRRFGERLGERAEVFAFARHCAEHGLDTEAHALLDEARKIPNLRDSKIDARPIEEVAADEMATAMIWRHTLDFGDPSIPRTVLLDRLRRFAASFPRSEHLAKAQEAIAVLERMVREDEEHAKTAKPWDEMSKEEQVAELIWRLRDTPGGQMMQPGSPWFYGEDEEKRPTPFAQLVAMGHDAVPQLIPALEDRRFTRCVGYWRDFVFSHYVQRVGDAALDALEEIAGRNFFEGTYTAAAMAKDGEAPAVRKRVEAWWADFRAKGEKAVLVALVEEGGMNAAGAMRQLVEKYPDAAGAATLRGLRVARGAARFNILGSIHDVRDEAVTAYLVELATTDPDPETRTLAAARALERGCVEVVPAAIELWRSARAGAGSGSHRTLSTIVYALVRSGAPEAISALAEGLETLAPSVARDVAHEAGGQLKYLSKVEDYPPASLRAVEDLVATLLEDRRDSGVTAYRNGAIRQRVCDEAAERLAATWGRAFELVADEDARDAQVLAVRNEARRRRGLAPLAPPTPVAIVRVPDADLRPLLDRIVAAPGESAAGDAVVGLGLGALPGIQAALDALPVDHPARPALTSLAARVAAIVREARVAEGSAAPPPAIADALADLAGRPLTSAALDALLLAALAAPPEGTQHVEVSAAARPGTGFVVTLRFAAPPAPAVARSDATWTTDVLLRVGRDDRYGPSGLTRLGGELPRPEDLRGLWSAFDAVLGAPASEPVSLRVAAARR